MERTIAQQLATYVAMKSHMKGYPVAVAVVDAMGVCRGLAGVDQVAAEDVQRAISVAALAVSAIAGGAPFCRLLRAGSPGTDAVPETHGAIAIAGENVEESYEFLDNAVDTFARTRRAVALA